MDDNKKRKFDECYEKPAKHRQWQERAERPIAVRPMTNDEIRHFKSVLVDSYQCDEKDITIHFQKILDEHDEDRDDCLWLKYKMKCVIAGKPEDRIIYTIKLPVPEEWKTKAENMRRQQATKSRMPRRKKLMDAGVKIEELPNANTTNVINANHIVTTPTTIIHARPKLIRPTRK